MVDVWDNTREGGGFFPYVARAFNDWEMEEVENFLPTILRLKGRKRKIKNKMKKIGRKSKRIDTYFAIQRIHERVGVYINPLFSKLKKQHDKIF